MFKLSQQDRRKLALVIFFVGILCLVAIGKQEYDIYQMRKDVEATQQRIVKLESEKKQLEQESKNLKEPKYLEKLAREEYNMVGKDEIPIFIVEKQAGK